MTLSTHLVRIACNHHTKWEMHSRNYMLFDQPLRAITGLDCSSGSFSFSFMEVNEYWLFKETEKQSTVILLSEIR